MLLVREQARTWGRGAAGSGSWGVPRLGAGGVGVQGTRGRGAHAHAHGTVVVGGKESY